MTVVTTFADRMIFIILTFLFSILRSHNLDWSYLFFVINGKETKNQYFCVLFITKKENSDFFFKYSISSLFHDNYGTEIHKSYWFIEKQSIKISLYKYMYIYFESLKHTVHVLWLKVFM